MRGALSVELDAFFREASRMPRLPNCVLGWSTLNQAPPSASSQMTVLGRFTS
jgi:hypothetical protein